MQSHLFKGTTAENRNPNSHRKPKKGLKPKFKTPERANMSKAEQKSIKQWNGKTPITCKKFFKCQSIEKEMNLLKQAAANNLLYTQLISILSPS